MEKCLELLETHLIKGTDEIDGLVLMRYTGVISPML